MKRRDVLASIFGTPVVLKAMDTPAEMDRKEGKTLLFLETREILHDAHLERLREQLKPLADRHNLEFAILEGGITVKRVS